MRKKILRAGQEHSCGGSRRDWSKRVERKNKKIKERVITVDSSGGFERTTAASTRGGENSKRKVLRGERKSVITGGGGEKRAALIKTDSSFRELKGKRKTPPTQQKNKKNP